MKRILIPTDFSDNAQNAVSFAAELANKISGEIYLLHVAETNHESSIYNTSDEWSRLASATEEVPHMIGKLKEIKLQLEEVKHQQSLKDLVVYDNIELGEPDIQINSYANKVNADIIIMGTRGIGKGKLAGGTAEKVVKSANCPVLSIHDALRNEPQSILFATDFTDEADHAFDPIKNFALVYNATIHLLTVVTKNKFESFSQSRKKINDFRERHAIPDFQYTIYNDHLKEAGIINFAHELGADMIALGSPGKRGLARFYNPGISVDLPTHSFFPVLTVNTSNGK